MTEALISNSNSTKTVKFLYSYGGKILPRSTDGKLRYVGGLTRVLAVDRSVSFKELMEKFEELCGLPMRLKCKLPSEDLDVLVSITCDDDLANVMDEYDRFSSSTHKDVKITTVLFPIRSLKTISPVSSVDDLCSTGSSGEFSSYSVARVRSAPPRSRDSSPKLGFRGGEVRYRPCCEQGRMPRQVYRCCEQGRPRQGYVTPRLNRCQ
ncbi:protein PAL OF QUIRKY-like [Rhododendron vialii]|uniref:protein PAL OF QUIRKY-like n=1 Tax=Rhododendron vialii TaxID=182163 RepID=UPI00265D736B|nr:protein PAL OF QUIRKY-like [Rhododendron vialii]